MADGLRTTLSRTENIAELILRHTDPSSVSANGYKALCEDLQKKLIDFKKTAKIINHRLQSICGKTGSKFSKNHKGLVKLIRLQANTRLFRRLQDRVSSHASSIGSLLLVMDTYYQQGFQEKLDIKIDRLLLLQEQSRLPNELGTQQVGTATSLPNKSKPFTIPRLATDFYRGRNDYFEDLLQKLNPSLVEGPEYSNRMIYISGDAGVGKTYLCSEFAEKYKTCYSGVLWIDDVLNDISAFYVENNRFESLNIPTQAADVANWLTGVHEPWLLVIDGAEDLTKWKCLSSCGDKKHILITTRTTQSDTATSVHISRMDTKDSQEFLLWAAGFLKPWCASDLAWSNDLIGKLGSNALPLTLAHVGATVRNGFSAPEDYLALLEEQETMETQADPSQDLQRLAFEVAIAQIRKQKDQSSKDAHKLLNAFALFPNRHMSLETATKAIITSKTIGGEQRRRYHKRFPTPKLIRRNGKAYNTPQSTSRRQSSDSVALSRVHWAIMELLDISAVIYHPSSGTYSMEAVLKSWIADSLGQSEREVWKNLAEMIAPQKASKESL